MKVVAYTRSHETDPEDVESREQQQARVAGYAAARGWPSISLWIHDEEPLETRLIERNSGILEREIVGAGDVVLAPRLRDVLIYPLALRRIMEEFESVEVELHFTDLGRVTHDERLHALVEALSRSDPMIFVTNRAVPPATVDEDYRGGKLPFGFKRNEQGQLIEDDRFQEKVRLILDLNAQGKSLRAISQALAERGIELSHVGVSRVLKRYEHVDTAS